MSSQTSPAVDALAQTVVEDARVAVNRHLTGDLWQMVLDAPLIAAAVKPGQFVHLLLDDTSAHILRRPLSVHGVQPVDTPRPAQVSLLYQVVGQGTSLLATYAKGARVSLLGPLGRGWHLPPDARRVLLVAGGVGLAPLTMLMDTALKQGKEVHLLLGARTGDYVRALLSSGHEGTHKGIEHIATDDGSLGYHGFNTSLLDALLSSHRFDYLATCGPEPMQRIVAQAALAHKIPCQVSLERRMACGLGACLSCVVDTTEGKKRACVDGPVFDAGEVCW